MSYTEASFIRSTPPAFFAPILGLVGLATGWRRASELYDMGGMFSLAVLISVLLIYIVYTASYVLKVMLRPLALIEDLTGLAGRLGLAALSLSGMFISASIVEVLPAFAFALLYVMLAVHVVLLVAVLAVLLSGKAENARANPAWHLTFVGFVAFPFGAIALGDTQAAYAVLLASIVVAIFVYAFSLRALLCAPMPLAHRPLQAIHLAPVSLLASVSMLLGQTGLAISMAIPAMLAALLLLVKLRWLIAGGFGPTWSAFTFPPTAFAGMLVLLHPVWSGFAWLGLGGLLATSAITFFVFFRLARLCVTGRLAEMTNASVA